MPSCPEFSSLDAIAGWAETLPAFDRASAEAAAARQMTLTKPPGSLGQLEALASFLAGWRETGRPVIDTAQALVFAGNHGVCAQGVNPFPQEVTAQMVANFEAGGAAINQLCGLSGAALTVIALDLDTPTADITEAPAMSEADCLDAMRRGADAVDPNADVLLLGEMGIGNSTISAALCHALFGLDAADWVGPGTGSDAEGRQHKAEVVSRAVARHAGLSPIQVLAALGGREQAAICGAVLAARAARIPVLLDGYICSAAVAPLHAADPALLAHCLVGHLSAEPGHARLLDALGKTAILNFDMALGEGTGAALALNILRGALACHNGMATFAQAGVAGAESAEA
ncbi:nicotinate-nucleotide--dimethylbenzimidazole phosphoribosyltransferase [Poseidonocella sedimentorum]|uniref:Nicotinate-nucleotide--dimethylbenzimidazole phosphoribosyltransferase n=1 Tax=Poseidonocella sedimentorum TaxID=871652 RepID=A0A1I6EKI1_9RHOB|nr:nicotinate-nucleotide--dimethylbenzimidazole phosphoribosyltransferase [Poseidonocella sedimentorum]SFR18137.1 nicotinate-nucleotide-dimethylbenzimidazole phosphoribosyltransferase [Poseidonocella sedimentorum]